MIYIKRFDTCFLRIPKTASQALQVFLQENVVDWSTDVVARPIVQFYSDVYKSAKNTRSSLITSTAHLTAQFVIDSGRCTPNTQFIGTLRNPYERQLSHYMSGLSKKTSSYKKDHQEIINDFRNNISTGVISTEDHDYHINNDYHIISQSSFFKHNGKLLDNIQMWLFEDLEHNLSLFCKQHDIKIKIPLRHINKSPGNKHQLAEVMYTDELRLKVYETYREDFEIYNKLRGQL
jgi:hypothetical protein